MTERRQKATQYLLELLKIYGRRSIIIKVTAEGPVCQAARTFVTRQLAQFSMPFPIDDLENTEKRHENPALDQDKLSVIMHLAVVEFKEAYLDDMCVGNSNANAYAVKVEDSINKTYGFLNMTFDNFEEEELVAFVEPSEKKIERTDESLAEDVRNEREKLEEMGHKEILTINDVNRMFWDLAYRHVTIGKSMKSAMVSMTDDVRLQGTIINNVRAYNSYIQQKKESDSEKKKENAPQILSAKALQKEYNKEVNQLRHDLKKDYNRKMNLIRQKYKPYKVVAQRLFRCLNNPNSKFSKSYDLTDISDAEDFVRWFEEGKLKVMDGVMKHIEGVYANRTDDLLFFRACVEAHNAKIMEDTEGGSEAEENKDSNDENEF